jgi:hypothetical protein
MEDQQIWTLEAGSLDMQPRNWQVKSISRMTIEILEPLQTKAPNPNLSQPYCCYINTVIFYVRPYTVRPWHHLYRGRDGWHVEKPGRLYEIWDETKTELRHESRVLFNGEEFECGGGSVFYMNKRWWMRRWARRVLKQEAIA